MVSSVRQEPQFNIGYLIDNALQKGVLHRRDHLALTAAMLSDPALTAEERNYINRLFDFIRMGRVQLRN